MGIRLKNIVDDGHGVLLLATCSLGLNSSQALHKYNSNAVFSLF